MTDNEFSSNFRNDIQLASCNWTNWFFGKDEQVIINIAHLGIA